LALTTPHVAGADDDDNNDDDDDTLTGQTHTLIHTFTHTYAIDLYFGVSQQ